MIDTTIRFNDHNSFKVTSILLGYPFGVEQMDYITHSFQAYSTSMLASATRARTKFLDADGATISDVSHAFAVTTVFGKVEITVAVPANAKQAQLVLLRGSSDWWLAEPKSEQGQVATPYNVNYAGQLTYITPNGIYTGMMTAGQIVVAGTTASPDETLDTKLVTISNGMINLSSTVSNKTTKITNEGVYTGEISATQITVDQIVGPQIADGAVSNAKIANLAVTNAKIADLAVTNGKIANLAVDNAKIASLSATKVVTGRLSSVSGQTYFDLDIPEIVQNATISGKSIKVEMSPLRPFRLTIGGRPSIYVTDASGFSGANILVTSPYDVNQDGRVDEEDVKIMFDKVLGVSRTYPPFWLMDIDGDGVVSSADLNKVYVNANFSDKLSTPGGRQLGVDGTGVFVSTNWGNSKSYIHTF